MISKSASLFIAYIVFIVAMLWLDTFAHEESHRAVMEQAGCKDVRIDYEWGFPIRARCVEWGAWHDFQLSREGNMMVDVQGYPATVFKMGALMTLMFVAAFIHNERGGKK